MYKQQLFNRTTQDVIHCFIDVKNRLITMPLTHSVASIFLKTSKYVLLLN